MPNKDISNERTLARTELGNAVPPAGSRLKISGERPRADCSSSPALLVLANGTEEQEDTEKPDFRSRPRRDAHEKLFRDFFELVLQRAVFQVGLETQKKYTHIYLFFFI